jgi:hypothetical protein
MATVYIAEFTNPSVYNGNLQGVAYMPPVAEQTVAIGGSSVQSSAFNAKTRLVRVHTDAICSVAFGSNPTATAAKARLAAGQTEYFEVSPGDKVAVITNT